MKIRRYLFILFIIKYKILEKNKLKDIINYFNEIKIKFNRTK